MNYLGFKYKILPTAEQVELLEQHFGSARFIYNYFLDLKSKTYDESKVNLSYNELSKNLTHLKKLEEYSWLKLVNAQTLQSSLRNLDTAYKNFFAKRSKFPKFKSKRSSYSRFNVPQDVRLEGETLFIPKFKGGIKVILHRPIKGTIKSATIERNPLGEFFVSILCEINSPTLVKPEIDEDTTLGIDLGISSYLTTSKGEKIENPKYLSNSQRKLSYTQRRYSKTKGRKAKRKLNKIHTKIKNQRLDFLHKLSNKLLSDSENQTICIEKLNIEGMLKDNPLAKHISDAGWAMFINMLTYKAKLKGKNILQVDTFYPSSKLCHKCNYKNDNLKLNQRAWQCPNCSSTLDRDLNAALNIKNKALEEHRVKIKDSCQVKPEAVTLEAPILEQFTVSSSIHQRLSPSKTC